MLELDLSQFEKKLIMRNIREEDIDEIVELANLSFGIPGVAFEREHYASHVRIFPEGQFCIEYDGKIVGACSSLIVNFEDYGDEHSFDDISGDGYIRNHNPDGRHLYGIDVVVHPDYQGLKIGRRLYEARTKLCRELNLESILFGGRMPNYYKYADKMTPHEYVEQVLNKNLYDPVITFQAMNGFEYKKVMANYLLNDKASLEYATLMEWRNDNYLPQVDRDYRRSLPVRISAVQYMLKEIKTFDDFAAQCEFFIRSSSQIRADFVVFPEAFTLQLSSLSVENVPSAQVRKLSQFTEDYVRLLTELAVKYSINIIGGTHFVQEQGSLYNAAFLFHRNGAINRQDKLHIPEDERKWWGTQPGEEVHLFDTDCGKVAILVGEDILVPEFARIAADQGAEIIFTPYSAYDQQGSFRIRCCAQARAIENGLFTVIAGTIGHLTRIPQLNTQYGQSAVFSPCDYAFPGGGVVAEGEPNIETVVTGEVDLEMLRRNRETGSVTPLKAWREQLKTVLTVEKA